MLSESNAEQEKQARLTRLKNDLLGYGLDGLEGRMQHGLDPAAMCALSETRQGIETVVQQVGGDMADVDAFIKDMHVGGIWRHAKELGDAQDIAALVWLALAHETEEKNEEGELLDDDGFLADVDRIRRVLKTFQEDPEALRAAAQREIDEAQEGFEVVDGVAFAEGEYPFLKMAIGGHTSGVWKDGELLFVAADKLDYSILEGMGYTATSREDRGRQATFWQKDGEDVVKEIYPGFGLVLNGDRDVAFDLARTAQND